MASYNTDFCRVCYAGDLWGPSECECAPKVVEQQQAPAKVHAPKKGPCRVHMSGRRCEDGIFCDYSHDKLPPCKFFLLGKCTRSPCAFPHIYPHPS